MYNNCPMPAFITSDILILISTFRFFSCFFVFFFFKQKTAYEMRISDWSSDVCSSDLVDHWRAAFAGHYRTLSTQFVLLALQVSHRPRQHCRHLELMIRPFAPGELSNHRMPEWPILLTHSNMSRWSDLT